MINSLLQKIRKAPWVLGQKLTRKPENEHAVVSDLFIWRCDQNWSTDFELLDLNYLFGEKGGHGARVVFFDSNGNQVFQTHVKTLGGKRNTLNINELLSELSDLPGSYGTFCVFHQQPPVSVLKSNSFLAERGYVRYRYKNLPLCSYVHGNLDAIDNDLTLLSDNSFLDRMYSLQYRLEPDKQYEIALANASLTGKKVVFKVLGFDGDLQMHKEVFLESKQVYIFSVSSLSNFSRLTIQSKMIMARPVIFRFDNGKMDVFHG